MLKHHQPHRGQQDHLGRHNVLPSRLMGLVFIFKVDTFPFDIDVDPQIRISHQRHSIEIVHADHQPQNTNYIAAEQELDRPDDEDALASRFSVRLAY